MLIIGLFLVGGGSAALLSTFGTVTGEADVDQAVVLNDGPAFSFDGAQTAGETEIETRALESNANVTTEIGLETTCSNSTSSYSNTETGDFLDWNSTSGCTGIDTKYVEYFDSAGHDFSDYEPSYSEGDSNVVYVDGSGGDIQDAFDNDVTGSTEAVLVADGTYDPFTVDEDVTVVAENQGEATITGGDIGISVTADGATVKGFEVQADEGSDGSDNSRGIDVLASDVTVRSNYVHSVSDEERPIGIHLWGKNNDVSNTKVVNNLVEDVKATGLAATLSEDRSISKAKGIAVSGGGTDNAIDVEISHNTVKEIGNKSTQLASAINIYGGAKNFDVSSNVVGSVDHKVSQSNPKALYDLGVYVSGYSSTSELGLDAVVTKNNFVSTDSDQLDVTSLSGDAELNASDNWFGTNGIQTGPAVDASWKNKTDTSIEAGTTDEFGVVNEFAINLVPDTYDLTTSITPAGAEETPS
jgi:hypothetical protein